MEEHSENAGFPLEKLPNSALLNSVQLQYFVMMHPKFDASYILEGEEEEALRSSVDREPEKGPDARLCRLSNKLVLPSFYASLIFVLNILATSFKSRHNLSLVVINGDLPTVYRRGKETVVGGINDEADKQLSR
ncbi:hypothetical protein NDU88_002014 [Pleurodeles waltl]|uniref:Uncharacterized protein n=1 Tax=Pleurodeles waltl TaxID=8319 RepID=A0AAV7UUC5_PLEWA|nr:hypothetical protein NDU88_002014 [Pleurodeles waltl]